MNIKIICVGRLKEKYLKMAQDEYLKRLGPYAKVEVIEIKDEDIKENFSESEVELAKEREGEGILSKIKDRDLVFTMEIEGKQRSSEEFANEIENLMIYGNSDIAFIIGGSCGISKEVMKRSDRKISFSKMTFPHQIIRINLLEQIYRAFKIIKNEPYHK